MSDKKNVPPHEEGDNRRTLPEEEDSISNPEMVPSETNLVLTPEEFVSDSDEEEGLSEHRNDQEEESESQGEDEDTSGDEVDELQQLMLLNDMIQQAVNNAGNVEVEEYSASETAPTVEDTVKDVKEKIVTPSRSTEEEAEMSYTDSDGTDGYDSSSAPGSPSAPKRPKTKSNRCGMCNKKLGLTGIQCRCGGVFCAQHRYSNEHNCPFDYRELGAAEIRKNNPVVAGQKINKI